MKRLFAVFVAVALTACNSGGSLTVGPIHNASGTVTGNAIGTSGGSTISAAVTATVSGGSVSGSLAGIERRSGQSASSPATTVGASGTLSGTISGNNVSITVTGTTANGGTFSMTLTGTVNGNSFAASGSAALGGSVSGTISINVSGAVGSGSQNWSFTALGGCGGCTSSQTSGQLTVDSNGNFTGSATSQSTYSNGVCINNGIVTGSFSTTAATMSFSGSAAVGSGSTDPNCTGGTVTGSGTTNAVFPNATSASFSGTDNLGHMFTGTATRH